MDSFSVWHWLIVAIFAVAWGYPLAKLSRRTGHNSAWGWIAGVIALPTGGVAPLIFVWWLSHAVWEAPPPTVVSY